MEKRRETPRFFSEFALLMGAQKTRLCSWGVSVPPISQEIPRKEIPDVSYLRAEHSPASAFEP